MLIITQQAIKLSNDLIIFWGRITSNGTVPKNGTKSETFIYPIAITTRCLRVISSSAAQFNCASHTDEETALAQCTTSMKNVDTANSYNAYSMFLIGIGY